MLIIKAEAPSGLSIGEAIEDALSLSNRVGCMVEMEINDIPMLFTDYPLYGSTREDRVENYYKEWKRKLEERNA